MFPVYSTALGPIGAIENESPGLTLRIAWIRSGEVEDGQRRRQPNRQFLSKRQPMRLDSTSHHGKSAENKVAIGEECQLQLIQFGGIPKTPRAVQGRR